MKKVIVVSALAMAGVFSAQALADRGKTGFYVTGKAGASVVTQTDQRFRQDFGDDVYKYKGGDKNDTVFGAGNDSNLLIVFYVQIMPDDFVMQLHR
ncbi:hypothetical protein PO520_23755, partial [Escherichia coli]